MGIWKEREGDLSATKKERIGRDGVAFVLGRVRQARPADEHPEVVSLLISPYLLFSSRLVAGLI